MLNPLKLKGEFIRALSSAWDPDAIWPGCKDGYKPGVSHPSYGQCLVGTLATWAAHDGANGSLKIVAGILEGDNMPKGGVWHFQLFDMLSAYTATQIDVTWDQVKNGVFTPVFSSQDPDLYRKILEGSFLEDHTLVTRLQVILKNLKKQGYAVGVPAQKIVEAAYDSLNL